MICKQCNKYFETSEGNKLGKLCSHTCSNVYYKRNNNKGQKKGKNLPKKALIFVLYYYHGITIRRSNEVKKLLTEVPYLIQDEKFKIEIEKCLK
jgi:hypothetical protein